MVSNKLQDVGIRDLVIFFVSVDLSRIKLILVSLCVAEVQKKLSLLFDLMTELQLLPVKLIDELKSEFKIKSKEALYFLGLEINTKQDENIIKVC